MIYDLAIIGGGPAGLSAAIYAARFRMKFVVLAGNMGGTLVNTHLIENWPGEKSLSGAALMDKMREHAESLGALIKMASVSKISKKGDAFAISTDSGDFEAASIILATGTKHRKLGVPGEDKFHGRGVSYCAVCDAAFFRNKTVAVIGGSDSAAKEALLLSEFAQKAYLIYRKEKIRAEPINAERVAKNKKIEVITKTNVVEIKGDKFVTKAVLDKPHNSSKELSLDGVFIDIGHDPESGIASGLGVELDKASEIIVGCGLETNVPGVFAAGDVTSGSFKQAISAAAQGAIAASSAYRFISGCI